MANMDNLRQRKAFSVVMLSKLANVPMFLEWIRN
jgi:hypothetical protein